MFDQKHVDRIQKEIDLARGLVPDGEWNHEGDRHLFKYRGFDCLMQRNQMLVWCGYVGLKPGHPWFGKHHDEIDVSVHGSLTYSKSCSGHICHPTDGDDELFWIGFDCGHGWDILPSMERMSIPFSDATYKTKEYVEKEIRGLADQALKAAEGTYYNRFKNMLGIRRR